MARLQLFNGFTFNQINHQINYPIAVNPKLNSSGTAFKYSKAEAIVPVLGSIGSYKLVLKGNFKQKVFPGADPIDGRIESAKLVGPAGTYFIIDKITTKIDPFDVWLASLNTPLNPTALTDLIFSGGIQISLTAGDDFYSGTNADDIIDGKGGNDSIFGNSGNDKLIGGGGDDFLFGGMGKDKLIGGSGNDYLSDVAGANKMVGGKGNDQIVGGSNGDKAYGGDGNDTVNGAAGNDNLDGQSGDDLVLGGTGNDLVRGGSGSDTVQGDDGNDTVDGGSGQDRILGGLGKDLLIGGKGIDSFVFLDANESLTGKANRDIIKDFGSKSGETIDLSAIDAGSAPGDQAFAFIGKSGFGGSEGELRFTKSKKKTLVEADLDGDGTADFQIQLAGGFNLDIGDFIL